MDYRQLKLTLKNLQTAQFNDDIQFMKTQTQTSQYLNTFNEDTYLKQMIGEITAATQTSFRNILQTVFDHIENQIQSNKKLFIEEVHESYLKKIPPGEFLYQKEEIDYNTRFKHFIEYVKNYCIFKEESSPIEFVNWVCDITNYFALGIHRKTYKDSPRIIIYFKCNYSGNCITGKGCCCDYQLRLYFGDDGKLKEIVEIPLNDNKHNHCLSLEKLFADCSNMTDNQRDYIRQEIAKVGLRQYKLTHKTRVQPRFLNRILDENKVANRIEKEFINSLKFNDDGYSVIRNTFTDGSLHSLLYINSKVAEKGYSRDLWVVDDSSCTNKYNKKLLTIVTKDDSGHRQTVAFGIMFDNSTDSFDKLFEPLKKNVDYNPLVILCDRSQPQIKSLENILEIQR